MSCVDASLLLPFLLASGVAALASCGLSLATLRGVRDMNFASPHDGEAGAVREAQAGVIQALVHVEGRLLHGLVRADEAMEEAALNVYERLDDARLSFADCASFAVMRAREIHIAYSTQGGQAESA